MEEQYIGKPGDPNGSILAKKGWHELYQTNCEVCSHTKVCSLKADKAELEGGLPITTLPFESFLICREFDQAEPTARDMFQQMQQSYTGGRS